MGWVVSASPAAGPSSLPAELPVTIHYQASWNTDHDGKQQLFEKGSCSVHLYGRMKRLEGESPFFSQYVPAGVTASYTYREEIIARPYDGKGPCKGVIGVLTASGTASPGEAFGADKAGMFLQVFSGPLGVGALLQASGDPAVTDPEALLQRMNQDPSRTLYAFNLMIPISVKVDEKPGCETLNTAKLDFPISLSGIRELGRTGIEGNFSWNTGDKANAGASIKAVEGKIEYGPEPGKKRIGHATFSWGFGEVEPSVALFLHEDGERVDITNDEADVLAGRKVKLEAVVYPYKDEGTKGQWTVPASTIAGLDGYDEDMSHGRILPLDEAAKGRPIVEFFCLDGSAAGKTAQVSYSATVRGRKVEGKGRLKVYAPTAALDVIPERTISIGKVTSKDSCAVYLGNITATQALPGIEIKASVQFPSEFDRYAKEHKLAYVQVLKESILDQKAADYFITQSSQYELDKRFPYAGLSGQNSLDMNDTPSDSISTLTKSIHHFQTFRTTLLVRPGKPGEALWLPIETVPWEWKFSLERIKENPGWDETCDPANFRIYNVRFRLPGPRERFSGKPEDVPHWESVMDERTEATHFRDDEQWKRELEKWSER